MTGAPILQNAVAGVMLAVEIAWGADLTDLTGASWTWTDVTGDVLYSPGVDILIGRPDESQQTQTSQLTVTLDNRSGNYSQGGQSVNYPNVRHNTPVRVRVSLNSGSTWTVKYQGNAVGFTPSWDTTGKWATVVLTAAGWLRQLNQGTLATPSAMTQAMTGDSRLIGYWPLEDNPTATSGVSAVAGVGPAVWGTTPCTGPGKFGTYGAFYGSRPIVKIVTGSGLICPVPTTSTTSLQIVFLLGNTSGTTNPDSTNFGPVQFASNIMHMSLSGTLGSVELFHFNDDGDGKGGGLALYLNGAQVTNTQFFSDANEQLIVIQLSNSGANVAWKLTAKIQGSAFSVFSSGTVTGKTVGGPNGQLIFGEYPVSHEGPSNIGQAMVLTPISSNIDTDIISTSFNGNSPETPIARLTRLATLVGIPLTVLTSAVAETSANTIDVMGPQYFDTTTNLLRECESTSLGVLYDGLNPGLTFVTRLLRESQQPSMTVDASSSPSAVVMPFAPVDDDQLTINDAQVTRRNGGTGAFQDVTGAAGVNAIGDYQTSLTVNPADDTALANYARWLVHLGTLPGYRYPTFSFELEKVPSLITSWLTCIPSCRIDVTNITSARTQHPTGTIKNVLEGWHETITQHTWRVDANCTNWQGWNVATMAASTGTTVDTVARCDTDGSAVNTAASAGATSVSVKLTAAGKPLWVTGSGDDFPMTVSLNGVPVVVTAISGASSPQTFTVPAGIPFAVAVNAPVALWNPPVLGM